MTRHNGHAIRAIREKDGWTQTALAKAAGITQPALSQIESESCNAEVATLNRIARKLHVPLDAIMRNPDDAEDASEPEPEAIPEPAGAAA